VSFVWCSCNEIIQVVSQGVLYCVWNLLVLVAEEVARSSYLYVAPSSKYVIWRLPATCPTCLVYFCTKEPRPCQTHHYPPWHVHYLGKAWIWCHLWFSMSHGESQTSGYESVSIVNVAGYSPLRDLGMYGSDYPPCTIWITQVPDHKPLAINLFGAILRELPTISISKLVILHQYILHLWHRPCGLSRSNSVPFHHARSTCEALVARHVWACYTCKMGSKQ